MAAAPRPSQCGVLNSWKEIAGYLGRGVRTVQRYERDLGLPVRRPRGTARSAVIAFAAELDEWLRVAPKSAHRDAPGATTPGLVTALRKSVHETAALRQLCSDLRHANLDAMHTLFDTIQRMQELLRFTREAREDMTSVRPHGERRRSDVSSRPN